ncbi:proteasome subunit beta type-3-A-like [Hevea brasiliensis]|uniref:proteasome subunit beta type-3-A-like n=1 Tax=Hevea brasiliensis TaxID=3981 RepID=UPI0025F4A916|nr:proteasome subunit beta type-3-A-like [Hevea brasiliensis]
MEGKNCFAIASDWRLGVQLQAIATDFQRIYKVPDRRFLGISGTSCKKRGTWSLLYEKSLSGPYFCQPEIAGLSDEDKPFICTMKMDTIGAKNANELYLLTVGGHKLVLLTSLFNSAKVFVVAGTASESLYGACEAMFKPDMRYFVSNSGKHD